MLAAGLVVVCAFGYRVLSKNRALGDSLAAAQSGRAAAVTSTETASAESVSAALPGPAEPEPASAASSAESAASASASAAAATPRAEPARSAAAAAAVGAEIRRVTVKSKPAKVRFFHFGKQVGVTPFVLEFKPGERHAYEAGLPGYGTRKVVIDGSKPEITVGLKKDKP